MSETESKLEALEAKVKKLISSHKLLTDENNKLKEEIKLLKNQDNLPKNLVGRKGRPSKDATILTLSSPDFSDVKSVKKMIDSLIVEIDKIIKKLED